MASSEKKSVSRDVFIRVAAGVTLVAILALIKWNTDLFSKLWAYLKSNADLPLWTFWLLVALLILCGYQLFAPLIRERKRRSYGQVRQTDVDGETDLTDVFRMVDKLLFKFNDVEIALAPGRAFLLVKDYGKSLRVFHRVREVVSPTHHDYYIILGNIGYSLSGLGRQDEAIEYLLRVRDYNNGETFFAWHTIAIAYAYFKLKDMKSFRKWLAESKKKSEYKENIEWFGKLYPEIKEYLL